MEAVKAFNSELSSLYEVKPPISKAKMTALTRGAIKAIKFYKHVVQSVEKFILKCKPEYKVPGLYVIDSIVRQSRHQFGSDKDVFAPRFAKNLQQTFLNLFKCPPEDKSKIIRVLNLWQKNQVFAPEVIQPLFDLADPNNPIYKELGTIQQANGMNSSTVQQVMTKGSPALQKTSTKGTQPGGDTGHGPATNLNLTDPNVLQQLQHLQRLLTMNAESSRSDSQIHFDKKLLDFDYGDDDDEVNPSPRPPQANANDSVTSLLTNPEVLRQLQTLQQTMVSAQQGEMDMDKMKKLQEMKQQEEEFDQRLAQTVPNLPFASECEFKPGNNSMLGAYYLPSGQDSSQQQNDYEMPQHDAFGASGNNDNTNDVEVITLDHDDSRSASPEDRYSSRRRRSRSRSRDRGRDRDRDRDRRSRRSRSRSKSRRRRSKSRDRDRKDRDKKEKKDERETERDRERKKRGLPVIKKDHLSVCSTTLWVGHLSKLVHQDDLSNTFGEFGDIVSIDLIPPRGCAFIVMDRRQDATRCLTKLKNHNLHGKAITLAWAPGKGVKGKDLKDYWEGDLGVSYIPWGKLKEDTDIEMLEDGGTIDEDTMPPWMKQKMEELNKKKPTNVSKEMVPFMLGDVGNSSVVDTSQPPPMPGAGLMQPPLLPLVSPFQFNNRLLGMNVPPGMMPNIPLGVPPPNMPTPMMTNSLLGLGSPFQGGPGLMAAQHQMPQMDNKPTPPPPSSISETNLRSLTETLMSMTQPFGLLAQPPAGLMAHHDDNMDVEMEDAVDKNDKPLNEQFAPMHQSGGYGRDDRRDRRDDRSRRRSRSRDRGREQNRNRDRGRRGGSRDGRDNRERDRRDRDSSRGRDRDRRNRWGPADNARDNSHREDRRDREKNLQERLQEMAGMSVEDRGPRDRRNSDTGPPNQPHEDAFRPDGVPGDVPPMKFDPPPMERGAEFPDEIPDDVAFHGPPDRFIPPEENMFRRGPNFPMDEGAPMDDFGSPFRGPREEILPFDEPPERFMRGGRRGDFRDERGLRGPEFFPREDFGPRGPRFGPEFGPRGPILGPRGPRGQFFGPRGIPRGPRGPPFRDGPGFNPRFDGPPQFFRGGRGPPPRMFDEPFIRQRGPRFDDRWRGPRPDFRQGGPDFGPGCPEFGSGEPELEGAPGDDHPAPDFHEQASEREVSVERADKRRSRWGADEEVTTEEQLAVEAVEEKNFEENNASREDKGGNTPLRDEAGENHEEPCKTEHQVNEVEPQVDDEKVQEDEGANVSE